MSLGYTVKRLRKGQGLSQDQLAARTGVSQARLSQIEKNVRQGSIETLQAISAGLGVTPNTLLGHDYEIEAAEEAAIKTLNDALVGKSEDFIWALVNLVKTTK